jgi:hypothetical protein
MREACRLAGAARAEKQQTCLNETVKRGLKFGLESNAATRKLSVQARTCSTLPTALYSANRDGRSLAWKASNRLSKTAQALWRCEIKATAAKAPTMLPCSFHFFRSRGVLFLELRNSQMSQCSLSKGFL